MSLRKAIAGGLMRSLRAYLQYCPLQKGKGVIWDITKCIVKRHPQAFAPSVVRSRSGNKMLVRFNEFHERNVFFWGTWTPTIERLMAETLTEGDVFIDVGANVGYLTLLGAKLVANSGQVFAFEPSSLNYRMLEQNVLLNSLKNISMYNCAVSDHEGNVKLFVPEKDGTLSSMRSVAGQEVGSQVTMEIVAMTPLDHVISSNIDQRIRLIKLDIEGAEYLALRGMQRILSAQPGPDIICEVSDVYLRQMKSSAREVYQHMRDHRYESYLIAASGLTKMTEAEWKRLQIDASNYQAGMYPQIDVFFTRRLK